MNVKIVGVMENNLSDFNKPSQFDERTLWYLFLIVAGETGAEKITSEDLFGKGANSKEILLAKKWDVLEVQDAESDKPAYITFNITYYQPNAGYKKTIEHPSWHRLPEPIEIPYISNNLLYTQQMKVYLATEEDKLRFMPVNEMDPTEDPSSLLCLKSDIKGNDVINASDDEIFPHQQKYLRIYAQNKPALTKSAKLSRIHTGHPTLIVSDFINIRFHSKVAEIYHKEEGIEPSDAMIASISDDISNNSGRSGAFTYRFRFVNTRKGGKNFDCVFTVTEGETQRRVAEHAVACQQKFREKGIPVARIHRPVTPYYYEATEQSYYIQQFVKGTHFNFDERHLEKLGKAMADIHNIPVQEMPVATIKHELPENVLIADIQQAIEILRNRSDISPIFATDEEMRVSMIKQLLSRFSRQELQSKPTLRNLCQELRMKHSDMEKFSYSTQKQQQQNSILRKGVCWGDMHLPNLLGDEKGNITLLDFQQCGEGVLADELALTTYFLLAGDDGRFDASRTRTFFTPYCKGREQQDKPGPLTQEEIIAILEKVHDLCQRQAHLIWMMMNKQPVEIYETFSRRHHGMREQIETYMQNGKVTAEGANRFAEAFLSRSLTSFPSIADTPLAERMDRGVSMQKRGLR